MEKALCGKKFKTVHATMQHMRHCVKCARMVQKRFPGTAMRMPTAVSAGKENANEHNP